MTRRRRLAAGTLLGLVAGLAAGATTGVARAEEPPPATLGGYQGTAASSGIYGFYTPQGALPLGALVEVGAPDALATISTGPATFARASALDPGDVMANPDAALTLAMPGWQQGTIPPYPYRVSAGSGFGEPVAESSPAPGLNARAEAKPDGSTARATMPRAEGAAIATFGSLSSLATTKTDDATVTVHVRTEVTGFELLGLLRIDSIVTDLTATSDGGAPKLTGGTTISGASLAGQAVTIDAKGIHQGGQTSGPAVTTDALNQLLANAGITVTLASPVKQDTETTGQLATTGLRIQLDLSEKTVPALGALAALSGLPPVELASGAPTLADLVVAIRARHLTRIEVGRGMVSLSTSGGDASIPADGAAAPLEPGAPLPDLAPTAGGVALPAGSAALAPLPGGGPASRVLPAASARVPNVPLGAGVGVLVLLGFCVQPFAGARLARLASAVIGGDDSVSCPWEDT